MPAATVPNVHTQILVIGGGPAGCYAASALAREGLDVVLLEAVSFPRYHIGESLIPSVRHYLRFIGAQERVDAFGFVPKPGAALKLNQYKREGYTDFLTTGCSNGAWNVTRADFDQLLLDHARASGVKVYECTRVTSLRFAEGDGTALSRPVSAQWQRTDGFISGETAFDFVIDASGRTGLLSERYLHHRRYNSALKNIALWGYWTGIRTYGHGTAREGAPWFEALTDDSGWAWFIPLHDGTTSVGVVVEQKRYRERWAALPGTPTRARYEALLALSPHLMRLIDCGTLVAKTSEGNRRSSSHTLVYCAADFSYSAPRYAGRSFRIVGDAGAFIDPLFSSGVHLAMTSALSAAASICASIRGDCSEDVAAKWHTRRFTLSYTRFQMIVLSTYKQIRAIQFDVLNDVNEDGYERAFATIRPIIQGASDMGTRLSERELQSALDFCSRFCVPETEKEEGGALVMADIVEDAVGLGSFADARQVVQSEYLANSLEVEVIEGYVIRLQRGSLGLSRSTHSDGVVTELGNRPRAHTITGK